MAKSKYYAQLQLLQKSYDEMYEFLQDQMADCERMETELRYRSEYIEYKGLSEDFLYFRQNAHEEYDEDMPFPYLTL